MCTNAVNEELEEFIFTGYCKVKNQTTMVECKYSQQPYGLCLENIIGCDFQKCEHNKDCTLAKQILEKEDE